MRSVTAYATSGPKAPFEKTTIERRDLGPARRPDRDRVRRDLPLRHPHRPRRVGRRSTSRWCPGTRSPASSRRSGRRVTRYAVGDRVGVGCMVDSCRECENCRAGEEQYCLERQHRHLRLDRPGRHGHRRRLLHPHRRRRGLRPADPRRHRARRRRAAAVRRDHDVLAAAALGRRPRQAGRRRRPRRPRSHGASRSPTRWAPRSPSCRRSLRKAGRRPASSAPTTTTPPSDPATFNDARRHAST